MFRKWFFVGSTSTSVPAEFKNFRHWEFFQESETCINLTLRPTLILVGPRRACIKVALKVSLIQVKLYLRLSQGRRILEQGQSEVDVDLTVSFFGITMIISVLAVYQNFDT